MENERNTKIGEIASMVCQMNDEQLEAVSGGGCGGQKKTTCPKCSSTNIMKTGEDLEDGRMRYDYVCQDCLHRWTIRGTDF